MTRAKDIVIDNRVPEDPNYPMFEPAGFINDDRKVIIVKDGDYIVDRDGRIEIVTSGNAKWTENKWVDNWNKNFLRARYLGNNDDAMEYANQIRKATSAEIEVARRYDGTEHLKISSGGQIALL